MKSLSMTPIGPPEMQSPKAARRPKATDALDCYIGDQVRLHRLAAGVSQERLGELLGISFQQVQKYEKATNRISASRLQHIATVLEIPVSVFFENSCRQMTSPEGPTVADFLKSQEGMELVAAFLKIENPEMRRALIGLAHAAGSST